jgi:hypothetical protein
MATEIKLATQPMAAGPWRTVYECPAGKTAIVKSCIAANTGEAIATMPATLAVRRGAVTTAITGVIDIPTTSSVNLLAGTLTMQAGDKLMTYTASQSAVTNQLGGLPVEMGTITSMRARGTTLIAATTSGLWRTTDLVTWTLVHVAVGGSTLLNIGTTWFNYTSITTALRSTDDGLTWASIAVTNAPTRIGTTINGGIIAGHSGRYAGLAFSGVAYLTTSADGITWTLATATPQAIAYDGALLAWTGTHYITGRGATVSDIYRSTDGVAWATVTLTGMGTAITSATSNGAGTVVVTGQSNTTQVSTDHGATFASASVNNASRATYTGSVFFLRSTIPAGYAISATGLPGSWVYSRQVLTDSEKYVAYGSVLINTLTGGLQVSTDLSLTQSGAGLSATASLMEVTA